MANSQRIICILESIKISRVFDFSPICFIIPLIEFLAREGHNSSQRIIEAHTMSTGKENGAFKTIWVYESRYLVSI